MKSMRLICGLFSFVLLAQPLFAKRVALVIGNSNYGEGLALRNPANDAKAIAASLRGLHFEVIERYDQDLKGMEDALVIFNRTLKEGDVGWFFYAGHGMQAEKANYLIPVGAEIREAFELKHKTVEVETVKSAMASSGSRLNVVILDCCRDNPLTRKWTRSASSRGLAPVAEVPDGMIVAYSTAANATAQDGTGANSPFTEQLVNVLNSRPADGLEIKQVFFSVGQAVKKAIDQRPYLELDATMATYYLDRDLAPAVVEIGSDAQLPPIAIPPPAIVVNAPALLSPPATGAALAAGAAVVQVAPPGITNTVSSVFANGPYAAYNDYSRGRVLRKVQEKLQGAGIYKSKVDGNMGAGTQAAINAWQQNHQLSMTGLLDQATLQSMMLLGLAEDSAPVRAVAVKKSSGGGGKRSNSDGGDREDSGGGSYWKRNWPGLLRGGGPPAAPFP